VVSGVLSPYPKVAAYNYTCALTRYRLTTIAGGSIVDAAHIHQFSDSRNNDPRS
jgi:putative restriction endonuclease